MHLNTDGSIRVELYGLASEKSASVIGLLCRFAEPGPSGSRACSVTESLVLEDVFVRPHWRRNMKPLGAGEERAGDSHSAATPTVGRPSRPGATCDGPAPARQLAALPAQASGRAGATRPSPFLVPTLVPVVMIVLTSPDLRRRVVAPAALPDQVVPELSSCRGSVMLCAMMGGRATRPPPWSSTSRRRLSRTAYGCCRCEPASVVLGRLPVRCGTRHCPEASWSSSSVWPWAASLRGGLAGAIAILALLALWSLALQRHLLCGSGCGTRNAQAPFGMLPIFVAYHVPHHHLLVRLDAAPLGPGSSPPGIPLTYLIDGARVFVEPTVRLGSGG